MYKIWNTKKRMYFVSKSDELGVLWTELSSYAQTFDYADTAKLTKDSLGIDNLLVVL